MSSALLGYWEGSEFSEFSEDSEGSDYSDYSDYSEFTGYSYYSCSLGGFGTCVLLCRLRSRSGSAWWPAVCEAYTLPGG